MKKVEVLMSTYNGEKYVERQIRSILDQTGVEVHLTIRDDGSKDGTIETINNLNNQNPGKITLYVGANVGYRKSFLELLSLANDADYYAYSDQDDIWETSKLSVAVNFLEIEENSVKLYTSNLILVDENLNIIGKTGFKKQYSSLKSDFSRHRFAGCTYVFSRQLKDLANIINTVTIPISEYPDHDFFLSACAYSCGVVILDEDSYIKHVRLSSSVTSGGNGYIKRFKVEYNAVFHKKNKKHFVAHFLLEHYNAYMNEEAKEFLEKVKTYKDSLRNKISLINDSGFTSGIKVCDLERDVKIILSNY